LPEDSQVQQKVDEGNALLARVGLPRALAERFQ
jgi:hypothetical protein